MFTREAGLLVDAVAAVDDADDDLGACVVSAGAVEKEVTTTGPVCSADVCDSVTTVVPPTIVDGAADEPCTVDTTAGLLFTTVAIDVAAAGGEMTVVTGFVATAVDGVIGLPADVITCVDGATEDAAAETAVVTAAAVGLDTTTVDAVAADGEGDEAEAKEVANEVAAEALVAALGVGELTAAMMISVRSDRGE